MSRWPAKSLRIVFSPGEVAVLRRHGTPASRLLTGTGRGIADLLPQLDQTLAESSLNTRRVDVVLSQHFVRHVLTQPPGKPLASAEEHALVLASFRSIYGDETSRWNMQVLSQPPQHGLLGAAIDGAFLQQLEAMLGRHGLTDIAIRPLASLAARRLPKRFKGWWALVEPGWLSLFGGTGNAWQYVSGQPVDAHWLEALPESIALATEGTASTLPASVWVQSFGIGAVSAPVDQRERWQVLPHDQAVQGALALAGV